MTQRQQPNILVTGTPGVGKTVHSELIAQATGFLHISVNDAAKEHRCYESYDKERQSWIIDEDKLLDALETLLPPTGGCVLDYHSSSLFPQSWLDLVIVLRCSSAPLYDRLKARGYKEEKLQENLDAEIMGVLMEEAQESFDEGCVVELWSDGEGDDLEGNVGRVEDWVKAWRQRHREDGEAEESGGGGREK